MTYRRKKRKMWYYEARATPGIPLFSAELASINNEGSRASVDPSQVALQQDRRESHTAYEVLQTAKCVLVQWPSSLRKKPIN